MELPKEIEEKYGEKKISPGIVILIICLFIIGIFIIANSSSPQESSTPSVSQKTYISKDLEFATNRVIHYWKEKEPQTAGNMSFEEVAEIVKKVSIYRDVSYDRAADLLILALKTRDPDIIEFMR